MIQPQQTKVSANKNGGINPAYFKFVLVRPARFELATFTFGVCYSIP